METKVERQTAVRTALEVGRYLVSSKEATMAELVAATSLSAMSVKRAIHELRSMGAVIVSERDQAGWRYAWRNAEACQVRLWAWLAFEEQRTLLSLG